MTGSESPPEFEFVDHTADVGLRVRGETLERLFENAAHGLMHYLVEELEALQKIDSERIELRSTSDAELLVDWMNELLFRFDAREQIHAWAEVERVERGSLVAQSGYLPIDWNQHRFGGEVKSVTYHGLSLERHGDSWIAEVILDL